jgi:hypothetical protein
MKQLTRALFLTILSAAVVFGQTTGTITGTVTDSSKAVIAGVQGSRAKWSKLQPPPEGRATGRVRGVW